MKRTVLVLAVTLAVGIVVGVIGNEVLSAQHVKVTGLLRTDLARVKGNEAILSRVEIGPRYTGAKHLHPGDEIVYVLEGSAILGVEGKPDVTLKQGNAHYIPFGHVHFGKTVAEGVKVLVFRVHPKGMAVRMKVMQ